MEEKRSLCNKNVGFHNNKTSKKCFYCNKLISKQNYDEHINSHKYSKIKEEKRDKNQISINEKKRKYNIYLSSNSKEEDKKENINNIHQNNIDYNVDELELNDEDLDEGVTINNPKTFNISKNINKRTLRNTIHNNNFCDDNGENRNKEEEEEKNIINSITSNKKKIQENPLDNRGFNKFSNDSKIEKINDNTYKIGKNEFEDLTNEAKELKNEIAEREAYKKKILGIYNTEIDKEDIDNDDDKYRLIGGKIERFIEDHGEGILTVIDLIGCIVLNKTSICRTIGRIGNLFTGNNNNTIQVNSNSFMSDEPPPELKSKDNDLETIIKFLPTSEIVAKKKHENNNNCIICLGEFEIGEKISILPCTHIFHANCIENWLVLHLNCPVCKFQVTLSSLIGKFE